MLMPKRTKHRKQHRGKIRGIATRGNTLAFGEYGLQADIPIWRDKAYWERPVLVKGDGDIAGFRRWYSQFYDDSPAPTD